MGNRNLQNCGSHEETQEEHGSKLNGMRLFNFELRDMMQTEKSGTSIVERMNYLGPCCSVINSRRCYRFCSLPDGKPL